MVESIEEAETNYRNMIRGMLPDLGDPPCLKGVDPSVRATLARQSIYTIGTVLGLTREQVEEIFEEVKSGRQWQADGNRPAAGAHLL